MKVATMLGLAALMLIPLGGTVQAQGKRGDHAKKYGKGHYGHEAKPGRRVGPPPGPGRRVGPEDASRRSGSWGSRVLGRRDDLQLDESQARRIKAIDERYERDNVRMREKARVATDPNNTAEERDAARRLRDSRLREHREIDAVLTPDQRKRLKESGERDE
ncbi:MAG: hypothetical protein ABI637_04810 [Gemmatimonadota bacterium]